MESQGLAFFTYYSALRPISAVVYSFSLLSITLDGYTTVCYPFLS